MDQSRRSFTDLSQLQVRNKSKRSFFLLCYLTALSGTITLGFALSGFNQAAQVIILETQPDKPNFEISLINDATIAGLMLGSFFAGPIIRKGRMRAAHIANSLIILGCMPQMVLSLWFFLVGRAVVGFSCGLLLVTTQVYIQETLS